jgi:hypothetical protein
MITFNAPSWGQTLDWRQALLRIIGYRDQSLLRYPRLWGIVLLTAAIAACERNNDSTGGIQMQKEIASAIDVLNHRTVLFGHQSVGQNILDGLSMIDEPAAQRPNIQLAAAPLVQPLQHGITHFTFGQNGDPAAKVKKLVDVFSAIAGPGPDIALIKFCYADFSVESNVDAVLREYLDSMRELESAHPSTLFIYTTVPLTALRSDLKGRIKMWLGLISSGQEENVVRNHFNNLLRAEVGISGRLFDIAALESTRPDGAKQIFNSKGEMFESLVPAYTTDGGHLSKLGQRVISEQFLLFLAKLKLSAR